MLARRQSRRRIAAGRDLVRARLRQMGNLAEARFAQWHVRRPDDKRRALGVPHVDGGDDGTGSGEIINKSPFLP